MFYGINEEHHTVKVSDDEFKYQRKLMQDLMAPAFLHNIAAPQLYANFEDLVKMWSEKMRLSGGRPFSAKNDIYEVALEAIWAAVFGNNGGATPTRNQINELSRLKSLEMPSWTDGAAEFPDASVPPVLDAVLKITDSLEHVGKSPIPRTLGFAMRYLPSMRRHAKAKDLAVAEEIAKAEKRMVENKGDTKRMTNAVDHMLHREHVAAKKQNRAPNYQGKVMAAEVSIEDTSVKAHQSLTLYSSSASSSQATIPLPPHYAGQSNSSRPNKSSNKSFAQPYTPCTPPHVLKIVCPPLTKSSQAQATTSTPVSRKSFVAAARQTLSPEPLLPMLSSSATSYPRVLGS